MATESSGQIEKIEDIGTDSSAVVTRWLREIELVKRVVDADVKARLPSRMRDLLRLRFPPETPLADRYPDGFPELANAVYPIVSRDRGLREFYGRNGESPGMVATAQALGYSLGVSIDDVVLVNMQGFLELIDALQRSVLSWPVLRIIKLPK